MLITHLINRQNLYLSILAAILITVLLGPPRTSATSVPDNPIPYAQVLAVIVNNSVVEEANSSQVVVARAPNGCAPTEVVRKGLPLCKGDRITTKAAVMLKIAFDDPKDRNEVTIGSPTAESEITISSTSCGRVCQWFSSLRRPFTNWTRRVAFTNRSTVYQVVGKNDESVILYVYEGEVEAKKIEVDPDSGPTPAAVTEPAASPTPSSSPTAVTEPSPTASSSPATEAPPLVVGQLHKVIFSVEGNPSRPEKMNDTDVCVSLTASTDAEIALHQQPAELAGNVAKFPRWPDNATRDEKFKAFRCNSFLQPGNALNFEELGYIYNDWGDAEQALAYLAIAAEKWRAGLPDWMPRERYRINRAIALRQLGQYKDALKELDPMIIERDWVNDALNVRGSIYFDEARKVLLADRTEAGTTTAMQLLDKANADYEAAKEGASNQQQYVIVNLAQVSKTRGDIAQRLGDLAISDPMQRDAHYNEAEQHYIKAIELLKDSYGGNTRNTGINNSQNKIAGLLVARARSALANTYVAMGKTQDATTYYARAEEAYRKAISEENNFAAAYCGLASLNLILGKDESTENYRKCLTFNPSALVSEVQVPHLIGLRRAAAIQTLAEVGLQPEIVTEGETVESQDPAPGEQSQSGKTKIGTKVKISLQAVRQ